MIKITRFSFSLLVLLALLGGCGWIDDDGIERVERVAANIEVQYQRRSAENQLVLVQNETTAIGLASGCKLVCFDSAKNELFAEIALNEYIMAYEKYVLLKPEGSLVYQSFTRHEVLKEAFSKRVSACSTCIIKRYD